MKSKRATDVEERFKNLLKKANELGMDDETMRKMLEEKGLLKNALPTWKIIVIILLGTFLTLFFNLDLHRTAYYIYSDWRDGRTSIDQCAVPLPDTMFKIFRPPVKCSVCEDVKSIDKVSGLSKEEFELKYAYTGRPVIITDCTVNWTAPRIFSYEYFKYLYENRWNKQQTRGCQFFPYQTKFKHLTEFLNMSTEDMVKKSPWYVGWSNCDMEVTEILRQHYQRPYFLPSTAEGKRLDWIFMGSTGYGAPMHIDNVEYPSWQAQLRGSKKWVLQPPPECFYLCTSLQATVKSGETIVLDTNQWYHSTEIVSEEASITIGAEFD